MCKISVLAIFDKLKCRFQPKIACQFGGKIQMWLKTVPKNLAFKKILKVNFVRRTSTTFEFSRQNDMQFSLKIDVSDGKIWLKLNFCQMKIVDNPSF